MEALTNAQGALQDEAQTSAKNRRMSKIPRSRILAKITQGNRVSFGKENNPARTTFQAPGAFKKQPVHDLHRGSRGGKPPKPTIKYTRSLEDLTSTKELPSTAVQSTVHKPSLKPKGRVPEALSYQELKRLCHKLTQEQAMRCEEVATTEKKMAAMKVHITQYYAELYLPSVDYYGVTLLRMELA